MVFGIVLPLYITRSIYVHALSCNLSYPPSLTLSSCVQQCVTAEFWTRQSHVRLTDRCLATCQFSRSSIFQLELLSTTYTSTPSPFQLVHGPSMLSQPVSSSFSSARTLQADSTSPSFEGEVLQVSEDEAKQACALARSVLAKVQLPSPPKDLEVYQYPSETRCPGF